MPLQCITMARKGTSWVRARVRNMTDKCKTKKKRTTDTVELDVLGSSREISVCDFADLVVESKEQGTHTHTQLQHSYIHSSLPFESHIERLDDTWIQRVISDAAQSCDSLVPILASRAQSIETREGVAETENEAATANHRTSSFDSKFGQHSTQSSNATYYSGRIAFAHSNSFHHSHAHLLLVRSTEYAYIGSVDRTEFESESANVNHAGHYARFERSDAHVPLAELIARANAYGRGFGKESGGDEDVKEDEDADRKEEDEHSDVEEGTEEPCYALLFASDEQACLFNHVYLWEQDGELELDEQGLFWGFDGDWGKGEDEDGDER